MKIEHAKRFSQIIGVLILISTVLAWRFGISPKMLIRSQSRATVLMVLAMFPLWCLCLSGGIGLLKGHAYGFYCVAAAFFFGMVGSIISFIPFVPRLFCHSPNVLYYLWATNLAVVILLALLEYIARWRKAESGKRE